MAIKRIIGLCLGAFLIWGCAQVVPLTGGEKDEQPPQIVASSPVNFTTNFKGNRIALEFDEYIQVKGLEQKVIVSPPLKYPPEYIDKPKKLIMEINDTLLPNTTYNINFGEAIVDFTEGNPLDSNVFVFSTGDYVDSLFIVGTVRQAFSLAPVADVLVMAYSDTADSVPTVQRPDYFTKTDEAGTFRLDYMKEGDYKLFALKDLNSNYLFDLPNEPIAFCDSLITVRDQDSLDFRFFTEDVERQYVKSRSTEFFGKASVVLNRPLNFPKDELYKGFQVLNDLAPGDYLIEYLDADSIFMWLPNGLDDTLNLEIADDTGTIDTVQLRFPGKEDFLKAVEKEKEQFELVLKPSFSGSTHDFFEPLTLTANHPISSYSFDEALFVVDGDTLPLPENLKGDGQAKQSELNTLRTKWINYPWKPEKAYKLVIPDSAFVDLFGLTNDTLVIEFKTKPIRDYGELNLTVVGDSATQYIFHFLSGDQKTVLKSSEISGSGKIKYPYLNPGEYSFRIVVDSDRNGAWTTGDYSVNRQPENVFYYPDKVEIRANWDLDLEWILDP